MAIDNNKIILIGWRYEMDFILGCNYWASNAGADMWKDFDLFAVEKDLKILSEKGVSYIRVFPNWRDFQPVMPLLGGRGNLYSYCLEGEKKTTNPYYLDESMLDRFTAFLSICEKFNVKVIIGLITGWMSGRLFIPSALYGKNILTDPTALYFQQLFVKGFVSKFKYNKNIYAWDVGNEFNVLGTVGSREEACVYLAMITNAIRAEDNIRPVISGMAGLSLDKEWRIDDHALYTDVLTTHPYPYWCQYTRIDKTLSFRTTLHPTIQTKMFSEIAEKPCLAEEIGTMGPSVCSDEKAADFLRVNMFSLLSNGATGVMWWCACEQDTLESFPYLNEMVERELGILDKNLKPKPVLEEMAKFSNFLSKTDLELSPAKIDAICVLSKEQRHWGVAYMTCALLKSVGLNCKFKSWENELPDSKLYLLPSILGAHVMEKSAFDKLKKKVFDGATLYISLDNAIISGFEELTGVKVIDSCDCKNTGKIKYLEKEIELSRTVELVLEPTSANVLAVDDKGNPAITENQYGNGKVILLTYPLENNLVDKHDAFDEDYNVIYKGIFNEFIEENILSIANEKVVVTYHQNIDSITVFLINHSDADQELKIKLKDDYEIIKTYYGDLNLIKAFDACIFEVVTK